MKQYEHGGDIYRNRVRLDFSVNTNPLGISDNIKKAVLDSVNDFGVYPDAEYELLRSKIAEYEGVGSEQVSCSNGAAEMIFAVVRAVRPKKSLVVAPTFSEYERALRAAGSEIEYYYLNEENNFCIDYDFSERLNAVDMLFICNPNNPTGNVPDKAVMKKISDKCKKENIICVVDECFANLADCYSMKGTLPVIKAFTKTYAMAGLRLGYMVSDETFAQRVREQLPAWNVSAAAQAAGIAALEEKEYLEKSIAVIKEERAFLEKSLSKLGFKVFPSQANFILVKGRVGVDKALLEKGILIRNCDNFAGLDGSFYRIAVKTHKENEELMRELGDICG